MWGKRRKSESELDPEDGIAQIPGVGPAYVGRLQLQALPQSPAPPLVWPRDEMRTLNDGA